ncbi:uncharacterized protein LOC120126785 [Hibiscus syriacus]|uniref:uncharacterized protein LOC120126785 n=1 Tax=Hibiscus syriacus TaxID=106335 RepID=UPI0019210432|nr:uncharacterized protein LOC120126785 [Hibiscus syriacus]
MSAHLSKTDSEVSILSQSSPARSPRRQMYYVQIPSSDSHDGEKTTNSFNSTAHHLTPTPTLQHSFNEFRVQAGADFSGVSTEMVSINCTIKLTYRNTATFFGVHVTSAPLDLSYSQLTVATGSVNHLFHKLGIRSFYQSRKSQKSLIVTMKGSHIPLYGGGANLASLNGEPTQPLPLTLDFMVRSRAYVLGRLMKPKFYKRIQCWVTMDPKKMNKAISLQNKCIYS